MANAVVAVFDKYNEAQGAVNELLSAGFQKNEIKLSGQDGGAVEKTTTTREAKPRRGIKGFFDSLFGDQRLEQDARIYDEAVQHGNFVVTAIAGSEAKSEIATEVLSHHHPVNIDDRASEWLASRAEEKTIPVIEGEPKVGKREAQGGGVRVFTRVSEIPIEEEVTLREEPGLIDRKPASEADLRAFKEGTTELRETAEEAGVSKAPGGVEVERDYRAGEGDYRAHWQQAYGATGLQYEDYAPAYEYGSTAAASDPYRGRVWSEVEPTLRTDWEVRNPGTRWEQFKDAIRHAFDGNKRRP